MCVCVCVCVCAAYIFVQCVCVCVCVRAFHSPQRFFFSEGNTVHFPEPTGFGHQGKVYHRYQRYHSPQGFFTKGKSLP